MMTCDADCTMAGWIEYMVEAGCSDLHVSVAPDTDLGEIVLAFDHDEQCMIKINGWSCRFEPVN